MTALPDDLLTRADVVAYLRSAGHGFMSPGGNAHQGSVLLDAAIDVEQGRSCFRNASVIPTAMRASDLTQPLQAYEFGYSCSCGEELEAEFWTESFAEIQELITILKEDGLPVDHSITILRRMKQGPVEKVDH